jgi:hypothetical protein
VTVAVATGVIELFQHPPLGLITLEHIPEFPSLNDQHLQRVRGPIYVDAYGIRVLVLGAPAGYGLVNTLAGQNLFDRTVWTVGVETLLLTGDILADQLEERKEALGFVVFTDFFPYFVHVVPAPGVELDAWWMLRLGT